MWLTAVHVRAWELDGGTRAALAERYQLSRDSITAVAPRNDRDRLHAGEMVSIVGILVKRCRKCGTAWPLERFAMRSSNLSGCDAVCAGCRGCKIPSN